MSRPRSKPIKRGLDEGSGLYTDQTKYLPENFEDVRARTLAYMRVEDDAAFRRKHSNDKKPLSVRKPDFKVKPISQNLHDKSPTSDLKKRKVRPRLNSCSTRRFLLTASREHPRIWSSPLKIFSRPLDGRRRATGMTTRRINPDGATFTVIMAIRQTNV